MQPHRILVLDPGHFHAALPFKRSNPRLCPDLHVYAPAGPELERFLALIDSFNHRETDPTAWRLHVYRGEDSLPRLLAEQRGNLAILAGTNHDKSRKIAALAAAGINVLADKPLTVSRAGLPYLDEALSHPVAVTDMMTVRHDPWFALVAALTAEPDLFGGFATDQGDAISIDSVHCLSKQVAGAQLRRPPWYFDIERQGIGLADVSTHYLDFTIGLLARHRPESPLKLVTAQTWPTLVSTDEFHQVTEAPPWPDEISRFVIDDYLRLNANGELRLRSRDLSITLRIEWRSCAMPGIAEGVNLCCRGRHATLALLRQTGPEPQLQIIPERGRHAEVSRALARWQEKHPEITVGESDQRWRIKLPPQKQKNHEEQFAASLNTVLDYLDGKPFPEGERQQLRHKYSLLAEAVEYAAKLTTKR